MNDLISGLVIDSDGNWFMCVLILRTGIDVHLHLPHPITLR